MRKSHENLYIFPIYIYIYILTGKTQKKFNQNFKLEANFAPCVLNYLFLESFIF